MNKWIAEFDLEDGDTMPEHMDLNYMGAKIDFHCRPMWISVNERLPDKGQVVLWCNEYGSVFTSAITVRKGNSWDIGKRHRLSKIIAWMPLPDPYTPERRDKE